MNNAAMSIAARCAQQGLSTVKVAYEAIDALEKKLRDNEDTPDKFEPVRFKGVNNSGAGAMERRMSGSMYIGKTPTASTDESGRSNLRDLFDVHDQNVRSAAQAYPARSRFFSVKNAHAVDEDEWGGYAYMLDPDAKTAGFMQWLTHKTITKKVTRTTKLSSDVLGILDHMPPAPKLSSDVLAMLDMDSAPSLTTKTAGVGSFLLGSGARALEGLAGWGTKARSLYGGAKGVAKGVGDYTAQSLPGRMVSKALDPASRHMAILGPDRLSAMFNVGMGLEGARRGKEVGGTGGAIAGGLAGFGGSRAGWAIGGALHKGLVKAVQNRIGAGKNTFLASSTGGARNWLGDRLAGVTTRLGGKGALEEGKFLNRVVTKLKAPHTAMQEGGGLLLPGGKVVAQDANLMAKLRLPVSGALMLGGFGAGTAIGNQLEETGFNAYKRLAGDMHDQRQLAGARANMLRRMSPELRASQFNPYRNV